MAVKTLISEEEYLVNEVKALHKSEYHDGEVKMMAGTSPVHNQIVASLIAKLYDCLEQMGCVIYASDLLIHQAKCNKYVYPDITIVCEDANFQTNKQAGLEVLLNPKIIIEVLSESTELYDRTEKFDCYKIIDSIEEYILIDSKKILAETYKKTNKGWLLNSTKDLKEKVKIGNCEVLLEDIYRKVVFEEVKKN